ncbi:hypothetical protein BGY98DRAFT_936964 [Russula aff. rugulosa BPL654]|nr:hypothetical protein BGY98DRAFT_936964 [Russula aff. rugulosa BPL654]
MMKKSRLLRAWLSLAVPSPLLTVDPGGHPSKTSSATKVVGIHNRSTPSAYKNRYRSEDSETIYRQFHPPNFSSTATYLVLVLLDSRSRYTRRHIPQMYRYRTVGQTSPTPIHSIFNLTLADPIVVQGIHEARGDETVVAEDLAAMPKNWHRPPRLSPHLPASLYESASPHPSSPGLSEIPLQGWYRIYHHFGKFHRGGTMARVAPDDTTITGSSVVARVGTSPSPFKFRVIGDTIISVTYGLGSDND